VEARLWKPLAHWLGGGGKLEEVDADRDVFRDNSVMMLNLRGHTPGHHGLLVKLAGKGYVLLSGDIPQVTDLPSPCAVTVGLSGNR
jgi:glyoxylase-like metal-dependent hydrolase (beta-lactamase superfamily II)